MKLVAKLIVFVLNLLQVDESSEFLPLVYEPSSISAYWGKRPRAVATRVVQLLSVAGGFLSRLAWDVINKKVKEVKISCLFPFLSGPFSSLSLCMHAMLCIYLGR